MNKFYHFNNSNDNRVPFLKLPINYSIVTNIDQEHLDYYRNFKNLENSFIKFIEKTPPTGKSIICIDNKNIKKVKLKKFNKIGIPLNSSLNLNKLNKIIKK